MPVGPLLLLALLSAAVDGRSTLAASTAVERSGQTRELRLANGLRVLLRPVTGADTVALVVLHAIGGDHDPSGKSGLAHLVEHLLVTAAAGGAEARTVQEFMARYPDGWNVQTGAEYTVVAAVFSSRRLEEEMADAAARMRELRPVAADLAREKPRIREELRNMYGGIPELAARNLARERVRPTPRGGRRGGRPDDLEKITLEEVTRRLRELYTPRRATLVLAGDLDPGRAEELVRSHFAALPAGGSDPDAGAAGAIRPGRVQTTVRSRLGRAERHVTVAYRAPSAGQGDHAAFLMLVARLRAKASAFGAGPRNLSVRYAALDGPTHVSISRPVPPGGGPSSVDRVVEAIDSFVTATVREPLVHRDVPLTLRSFGFTLGLTSIPDSALRRNLYGLAFSIGRRAQLGIDPRKLRKRIESVGSEDLGRVAQAVFAAERRAVSVVSTESPEG